ncbi:MAG: hypothetical protein NTU73_13485 [Ignavibacteriae bacterium]|nr:hypothetical protein [Ignavibacteriota bacterium]
MDREKDYMDEIMSKKPENGGLIKQQKESYNDFLDFLSRQAKSFDACKISFIPFAEEKNGSEEVPMKLAAMSGEVSQQLSSKSEFYHNFEKNIALKIDIRFGNQIYATVIAESDVDLTEAIMFCKETGKYFLSGNQNEYYIGIIEKFDIKKFNFDLVFPVNEMIIFREDENYFQYIRSPELLIVSLEKESEGLSVKISQDTEIKTLILKTGLYKDFVNINKNEFLISDVLLDKKMEILIY